jgi:hypothetical protein
MDQSRERFCRLQVSFSHSFLICYSYFSGGDEVWRPGAMDQETSQVTSNGTDEWGADSNEQSTFGASTNDADGKCSFDLLSLQTDSVLTLLLSPTSRWLGIERSKWQHLGSYNRETRGNVW